MTIVAFLEAGLATRGALSAKQSAAIAKATPSVILGLSKDGLAEILALFTALNLPSWQGKRLSNYIVTGTLLIAIIVRIALDLRVLMRFQPLRNRDSDALNITPA